MKRLLLDTNIYGILFADKDFHLLHELLEDEKGKLRIYGFDIVRKELKEAPRKDISGVNVRAALLRAYSAFTVKEYPLEEEFKTLAEQYYQQYLSLGGGYTREKLFADFLIVACASVKEINIVVSEDNATLASELALKAYAQVSQEKGLYLPQFIRYEQFKKEVLSGKPSDPFVDNSNKFGILLGFLNIFPGVFLGFHEVIERKYIYKCFVS